MTLALAYTPQPLSLYGRMIAAVDVAEALRAQVAKHGDRYLNETERQHGLEVGWAQRPRALVIAPERFPEDQLPAIVIRSPGTAELPEPDGQGRYRARFELELEVGVAVSAGAFELASLYTVALRALILQQTPALGGRHFMGVDWIRERFDDPTLIGQRTYYTGRVELEAHVDEVVDRHAGPPDEDGWPDNGGSVSPEWPVSESADVEVVKVPIGDELVEKEGP
jgi:hypothetical protein